MERLPDDSKTPKRHQMPNFGYFFGNRMNTKTRKPLKSRGLREWAIQDLNPYRVS